MSLGFWLGLVLLAGFVGLAIFAIREFGKSVRAEENVKYQKRQIEAVANDKERADEIARKADEAGVTRDRVDPLNERLRRSGRGRPTDPPKG